MQNKEQNHDLIYKEIETKNGIVIMKQFTKDYGQFVQKICYEHFRSTSLAAVRYYLASHIIDILFLCFVAAIFMPLKSLIKSIILFNFYLFCKSRYEIEKYISKHCKDLEDINDFYLSNSQKSNFWIAELKNNDKKENVVGVIGLIPQDTTSAKIVRLFVTKNFRRMSIGKNLLNEAERFGLNCNIRNFYIYTNSLNPGHAAFVTKYGYTLVSTIPRGLMRGDLNIWRKEYKELDNGNNKNQDSNQNKSGKIFD